MNIYVYICVYRYIVFLTLFYLIQKTLTKNSLCDIICAFETQKALEEVFFFLKKKNSIIRIDNPLTVLSYPK